MHKYEIIIPEELHERCMEGMRKAKRAKITRRRRITAAACALATCMLVVTAPTIADAIRGEYIEIKNIFGAITGGEYVNATDEIRVTAIRDDELCIEVELLFPEDVPYRELETLRISGSNPEITTLPGEIIDGIACFRINDDSSGPIIIFSITGEKKADQPLEISGEWVVEIPPK